MTNRDRLLAVLDGRPVDRVPMWLLFPYNPTTDYTDVRRNPRYREIVAAADQYAVTLNRRNLKVPTFVDVDIWEEEAEQAGTKTVRQHWQSGKRRLYAEQSSGNGVTREKKLLNSAKDLEILSELTVNTDPQEIHQVLDGQLRQYLHEKKEFPEEYGAMMLDLGEPIGFLYHHSNLEEFSIWSLTHNDLVCRILDKFMERLRHIYRYCLERDLADVYFMVGSELASPPLVSRKTFQQWIVPYGKELVDLIHSYGKKVIMHYHGQIREILPDFVTMGADGLHTIESPPIGDCTLTEAFAEVGNHICLIGNVQYDCFRSYSPEEMETEVKRILDEAKGRRFILSPTAGPYEDDISDQVIRNYLQFMKTGWEYGQS